MKCVVSKVIYFRNLPSGRYTDAEFVNLVKAHGKAAQYILVPDRQEVRWHGAPAIHLLGSPFFTSVSLPHQIGLFSC